MPADAHLVTRLRDRLVGEMHLGHLRAGDRLPSIRELSREFTADHRAVAAALRVLEAERLIVFRGHTGVFVQEQERLGGELAGETAVWLAGVLREARRRRIGIPGFPDFVRDCTSRSQLRCGFVESNTDSSVAMCMELEEEFGLEALAVEAHRLDTAPADHPAELREMDLLASTVFHAPVVRAVAERLGKPFVAVTVSSEMAGIVQRRVAAGRLTVIVADAAYGERFESVYGGNRAGAVRVVLAGDHAGIARLDRTDPVVATRAARRLLPDLDLPLLLPRFPSISAESTEELAAWIIRLNLERAPFEAAEVG